MTKILKAEKLIVDVHGDGERLRIFDNDDKIMEAIQRWVSLDRRYCRGDIPESEWKTFDEFMTDEGFRLYTTETINLDAVEPKEPCLICNKEARDKLPAGAREITEELVREMPADRVPGLACWNCAGSGFTGDGDTTEKFQRALARIAEQS